MSEHRGWEAPAYSPLPARSLSRSNYAPSDNRRVESYAVAEAAPPVEVAQPRVRSLGNAQYASPPAYRTAERWDNDYRLRY